MKTKIISLFVLVLMVLSLTACGKFTCDVCGQEKSGISYKATSFLGEMTVCSDCYKDINKLQNAFK